jgi:hypothetical protein
MLPPAKTTEDQQLMTEAPQGRLYMRFPSIVPLFLP